MIASIFGLAPDFLKRLSKFAQNALVVVPVPFLRVGYATSNRPRTELALDALTMACTARKPAPGLIHHSDRGTQYGSVKYQDQLKRHQMLCSMSRPGKCGDNAVAESFFRTIKTESLYHADFRTREQARLAIFDYIEGFYNRTRMHSTLDYHSPEEYERLSVA